jgi:hypothetical protein
LADSPLGPEHAAALRGVADPKQSEQAGPMRPPVRGGAQPVQREHDLVHALHHHAVLLRLHQRRRRRRAELREVPASPSASSPPALAPAPLLPPRRWGRGRLLVEFPHRRGLLRLRGRERERLRRRRPQRVQVVAVEVERVARRGGPPGSGPGPAIGGRAGSTPVRAHDHGARRAALCVPCAAREGEGDLGVAAVRVWLSPGPGCSLRVAAAAVWLADAWVRKTLG